MSRYYCYNKTDAVLNLYVENIRYVIFPKGHRNVEKPNEKDYVTLNERQANEPNVLDLLNRGWIELIPVKKLSNEAGMKTIIDDSLKKMKEETKSLATQRMKELVSEVKTKSALEVGKIVPTLDLLTKKVIEITKTMNELEQKLKALEVPEPKKFKKKKAASLFEEGG